MWVFVILLVVPIVIQHVEIIGFEWDYKKKNTVSLAFFFVVLTVLIMFRHKSVGTDTRNYIHFFESWQSMSWIEIGKDSMEVGFSYFNKAVSIISKESRFFLAVTAIAVSAMIYPTYRRLCADASLTIVLFVTMSTFVMMFSGIRQMIAVGIGFVAYEFTRQKKIVPFIVCVVLAITFHTSAFMIAFMYPLYHARITKKWLYAVVPFLFVVLVFNKQIFMILGYILERYAGYDASITKTGAYTMLILFAIFTVFAFLVPDELLLDEETIGLRNFLLLALILQMFAPLHTIAMRMNYYYIIFIPLLLPKIIKCRSDRWEQVALWGRNIMVVFFFMYFFVNASGGGSLNVFPYHFFWESVYW